VHFFRRPCLAQREDHRASKTVAHDSGPILTFTRIIWSSDGQAWIFAAVLATERLLTLAQLIHENMGSPTGRELCELLRSLYVYAGRFVRRPGSERL
jgi:hypothetical protein